MARQRRPVVPPEVSNYIVDSYVRLRKVSKEDERNNKSHTYTSARTLLGILRLAQSLARLRFADSVEHGDIDEALRLMECSKESLHDDAEKDFEPDKSVVSQIYRLIKGMGGARGRRKRQKRMGKGPARERDMDVDSDEEEDDETLSMVDIRARVLNAGFTEVQLMETIRQVSLPFSVSRPRILMFLNSTRTWIFGSWSTMASNSNLILSVLEKYSSVLIPCFYSCVMYAVPLSSYPAWSFKIFSFKL